MSDLIHKEAFCLMEYTSKDGFLKEILWNSRDGVTPFIIMSVDGREMRHTNWNKDRFLPNFKPPKGMRIFVDAIEELVTPKLKEYIEKIFTEHNGGYWKTREEAFKTILPDWLKNGKEPWIIVSEG